MSWVLFTNIGLSYMLTVINSLVQCLSVMPGQDRRWKVEAGVTATPSAAEQALWEAVTASLGTVGGSSSLEKEVYLT